MRKVLLIVAESGEFVSTGFQPWARQFPARRLQAALDLPSLPLENRVVSVRLVGAKQIGDDVLEHLLSPRFCWPVPFHDLCRYTDHTNPAGVLRNGVTTKGDNRKTKAT